MIIATDSNELNAGIYISVHEKYAKAKIYIILIHRNYYILSTMYVKQNKLHQSNNAFQHTHNPVDEEGTS